MYGTRAAADIYHLARGNLAWGDAFEPDRDAALERASDWLDGAYIDRFTGSPTGGASQMRAWPRIGATDRYGNALTGVPVRIENATYEAALQELKKPGSLAPMIILGQEKVLTEVKGIKWTPMGKGVLAESLPFLSAVENLMGAVLIDKRGYPVHLVV